jgi:hypothetical protein
MAMTMTNPVQQFRSRRKKLASPQATEPAMPTAGTDAAISPQEFYREMVERDDVRRILTRLAQIEDGRA